MPYKSEKHIGASRNAARCLLWLFASLLAGFLGFACARQPSPLHATVPRVDLVRYSGRWYEIACYPNSFQEGCFATTATYTLRDDGGVGVLNQCRKGSMDGPDSMGTTGTSPNHVLITNPLPSPDMKCKSYFEMADGDAGAKKTNAASWHSKGTPVAFPFIQIENRIPDKHDEVQKYIFAVAQ